MRSWGCGIDGLMDGRMGNGINRRELKERRVEC